MVFLNVLEKRDLLRFCFNVLPVLESFSHDFQPFLSTHPHGEDPWFWIILFFSQRIFFFVFSQVEFLRRFFLPFSFSFSFL